MKKILVLSEEGVDFYPATGTDAVGHDQMKSSLTKLINNYNLTTCWPTGGIDKGPFYNIDLAVDLLDKTLTDNQKVPGVHAEFTSKETNEVEIWEYYGGNKKFNDLSAWRRIDSSVLNKILLKLFPLSASLSGGGIMKSGTTKTFTFTWSAYRQGVNVTAQADKKFNGKPVTTTSEEITFTNPKHSDSKTYTFSCTYEGMTASASSSVTVLDDCYYGSVEVGWIASAENIKALSKTSLKNGRGFERTGIEESNKILCYAYPTYHGSLSSIKDGNNFEYIDSYQKETIDIDGVNYFVYTTLSPVTVSGYKQKYS